jgi:hypothetical protein
MKSVDFAASYLRNNTWRTGGLIAGYRPHLRNEAVRVVLN